MKEMKTRQLEVNKTGIKWNVSISVSWFAWDPVAPITTSLLRIHLDSKHGWMFLWWTFLPETIRVLLHTPITLCHQGPTTPIKQACVHVTHCLDAPCVLVPSTHSSRFVLMTSPSHASWCLWWENSQWVCLSVAQHNVCVTSLRVFVVGFLEGVTSSGAWGNSDNSQQPYLAWPGPSGSSDRTTLWI